MRIQFKVNTDKLTASLLSAPKQLPFATALTLTRLAKDSADAVVAQLPKSFDRPTPFTLKAVSFSPASKSVPKASVYFKDSNAASGKAKNEHIRPGAFGASARAQKKTEYLLTRLGDLPSGWITIPGKTMPKDSYGNLPGAIYKQIVNVLQLKAHTQKGARPIYKASQKRASKLGVTAEFFTVTPGKNALAAGGGWLPPGVYRHLPGRKIVQYLRFVPRAKYAQRLDTRAVVLSTVKKQLPVRWAESFSDAMAGAIKFRRK